MRIGLAFFLLFIIAFDAVAESTTAIDYSGFWKENCEDPYGIQIIHHGDGLYTTRFCGPGGGCNKQPDTNTLIPIEGNPNYDVISPTELHEKIGGTVYSVIYKCTTDTNPVLKYSEESKAEGRRNFAIATALHVAYFIIALVVSRVLWTRIKSPSKMKRIFLKCGVIALLFTPSMYYFFPFATPSFALLALIFQLFDSMSGSALFLLPQVVISAVPIFIMWLLLVGVTLGVIKYRGRAKRLAKP